MPDVSSVCDKITEILSYDPLHPILFSSGLFLFLFAGFAFFYQFMRRAVMLRMIYVVLFSLYFYYKTSGLFLFLLVGMSVSDYVIGRFLCAARKQSLRKWLVALSLTIDIGVLCYFKYTNFFIGLLNDVSGRDWLDFQNIFLPVGISFFTFQSISYIIDLYKRRIDPADQWIDYLFYLSFFPQLVAGPIVKARDFMPQIRQKPIVVTREMFGMGIFLIISGLFKKAIISDYISLNFVDRIFDNPLLYSGFENLMGVYGYALQIYCDFSGYSDMAIGLALLLGFRFPKNFDSPYKSATITEFWRRWHISLSSWLKDYLYISLGGNRKGKARTYLNLFLTMLIGGLWHGAAIRFVLWGAWHGAGRAQMDGEPLPFVQKDGRGHGSLATGNRYHRHVPRRLFRLDHVPRTGHAQRHADNIPDIQPFQCRADPAGGFRLRNDLRTDGRRVPAAPAARSGRNLGKKGRYRRPRTGAGRHHHRPDLGNHADQIVRNPTVHLLPILGFPHRMFDRNGF